MCIGDLEVEVEEEEFILVDTVRHWRFDILHVRSLMGVRGKAEESFIVFVVLVFVFGVM